MNTKFTSLVALRAYLIVLVSCVFYYDTFSKALPGTYNNAVAPDDQDPQADGCSPVSTIACAGLQVSLPFNLSFTNAITGTIPDKNGVGTGFTVATPYSGTRIAADGQPSNPQVPGYEQSRITVTGGSLVLMASKGINFREENNQINSLGVKTGKNKKLQLDVKVINPINKSQAQQAGLLYGLDDKTYIKLGITNSKFELRKEKNDVSSTVTGNSNPDYRVSATVSGLSTKTVLLRMVIDSVAGTVNGFYSIDNGATFVNVGASYPSPGLDISSMGINNGEAFSGIFATYRNGTTSETYTFDDFAVRELEVNTPPFEAINFSFRPQGSPVLPGYTSEIGLPFDPVRKYGWISPTTKQPIDLRNNMRLRTGTGDVRQLSQVEMQNLRPGEVPGDWEMMVPNGMYRVSVSAGDYYFIDSDHQVNVEGLPTITDFIATTSNKFRISTSTVQVNDGKLTVDAVGGIHTKINFIEISPATPVSDWTAPTAGARFAGTLQSPGVYTSQVQIFLTASDIGSSGLAALQYSINNSEYVNYTAPFVIATTGTYTLNVKAVDANNNTTITSAYNFSVAGSTTNKTFAFSKDRLSFTVLKGSSVITQSVNLTSNPATTAYSLSKTEASWLTLPGNSGTLNFGASNINSNIDAGDYQALVTVSAAGYQPATLLVDLHVVDRLQVSTANFNFQDAATIPPLTYIRDYGQPFGLRSGKYQSAGLQFGWKRRSDGTPLSLVGNGFDRNTPDDVLLATLVYMQANNVSGTFPGVKTEGFWEMKVPNGTYDVTVSVGDGLVNTVPEYHTINIEGVNTINRFAPTGARGTITRFKEAKKRVTVSDELLTINADGGTNTKINFASVVPVSLSPYLFWATKTSNLIIEKETIENKILSLILGSSTGGASNYSLSVTYGAGATGWLTFNAAQSGAQANVSFNYTAAKYLALGIYKATIKATSSGYTSATLDIQINVVDGSKPYVISSNPVNGATNVSLSTASISANNLHVPAVEGYQGGIDNSTIDSNTVQLYKLVDNVYSKLKGVINGTGGGDAIGFTPASGLEANTVYRFVVTPGVRSYTGASLAPYEATFTTAAGKIDSGNVLAARFTKIAVPGTQNKKYTSLVIGPDGKFYALRLDGAIERYTINHADGSLSGQQIINTLINTYGKRSAIGLVFDKTSTASNLIAWVSHCSSGLSAAPSYDGNISRLSGNNLQNVQLVITKLPRSRRDHLVNSLAFGPDGAMYICQGSMNSAGRTDPDWQRDESLLSGAILRLDLNKLGAFALPLNVQTTTTQSLINNAPTVSSRMSDGTYNPYGSEAPLTIYGSGVRNAYDLLWHTNGQLYLPTNGSGGGGNSPASVAGTRRPNGDKYNGPAIPATEAIQPQHDWLFRINPARNIGYFGHPNPTRGEYVLNRGRDDNPKYLPSIIADAGYRPAAYDFGLNNSPNGVIEYKSNTFGGLLRGKILVCRFSGGGDIAVMQPGSLVKTTYTGIDDGIYDIVKVTTGSGNNGLVGMSGFGNPLDIVEDQENGNLYVIEYNWNDSPNLVTQITLLRVQTGSAPAIRVAAESANEPTADIETQNKKYEITLGNGGDGVLDVKSISIEGEDASKFEIADITLPTDATPLQIYKDDQVLFNVRSSVLQNQSLRAKLIVTTMDNTVREIDMNNVLQKDLARIGKGEDDEIKEPGHNMEVYPNPSFGKPVSVKLKNFSKLEPVTIYIYDLNGNILKSESAITDGKGELSTQIAMKDNKNYIVRVVYLSGFRYVKVINVN